MKNASQFPQFLLRLALGFGFIIPVMDRLGWIGKPGEKNISWGNWDAFVDYTHTLMPFLSMPITQIMGATASLCEAVIGVLLIIGFKIRIASWGGFFLTLLFALSMTLFLGFKAPMNYSVFAVCAAFLLLSTIPVYRWSLDLYFAKENK